MGKHLSIEHAYDQVEDNHPGCMWGIIHALDYHHWHYNVKRMLPHRRHHKRKHAKRNSHRSPKKKLGVHDSGEVQNLLDAEASHFLVNQSATETSSTYKRSLKARIKALVGEEICKEDDHKQQGLGFPARSRLGRTLSIHHLEPSDHGFNKTSTDRRNPIIFLPKKATPGATKLQHPSRMTAKVQQNFDMCGTENFMDYLDYSELSQNHTLSQEKSNEARETSENQALMQAKQFMQNASRWQLKEYVDVLELFQVNKELVQKFHQNTNVGKANCFHMHQASYTKAILTKSGSFPVASLSYSRHFRHGKLKHKQAEIWSFPKGENLRAGTQAPELVASKFPGGHCTNSRPLIADGSGGSLLNKEATVTSLGLTEESVDQRSSEVVIPLKDSRRRTEFAVKEDKNESNCTSLDALLGEVPNGYTHSISGKEMAGTWETSKMDGDGFSSFSSCHETDGSVYDLSKGTLRHRRTSSLNESLHRYSRLFEYNFSMKTKWNLSKSLKLTNEYEVPSGGSAPISFRRNRSLPHLDSYWSLQNEESRDAFNPDMPIRTAADSRTIIVNIIQSDSKPVGLPVTMNAENCLLLDVKEKTEHLDSMVERSDCSPEVFNLANLTVGTDDDGTAKMDGHCEEIDELTVGKHNSSKDQQITFIEIAGNKVPEPSPVSVLQSCFQEVVTSLAEFSTSEGLESRCNNSDEEESPVNLLNRSDTGLGPQSCSTTYPENFENPSKSVKNQSHIELHANDDADWNYVREVLERSGFNEKGFRGPWYSSNQPLNPLVFNELEESWWPHEPECSEEAISECCHRQLLFDLVNEVMLQIYERSFTYYPRALSSSCRIPPMPIRYHDSEELLKSISKLLVLKPELDKPLDEPVAQDLAKDDGWMNLQMESECVALELEDLIFDELLEELICS